MSSIATKPHLKSQSQHILQAVPFNQTSCGYFIHLFPLNSVGHGYGYTRGILGRGIAGKGRGTSLPYLQNLKVIFCLVNGGNLLYLSFYLYFTMILKVLDLHPFFQPLSSEKPAVKTRGTAGKGPGGRGMGQGKNTRGYTHDQPYH